MFKLFKQKCPVCKMELSGDKEHIEGFGKEFCSEGHAEEYRKKLAKEESKAAGRHGGGCCH